MKKLLFILLIFNLSYSTFGQNIKGRYTTTLIGVEVSDGSLGSVDTLKSRYLDSRIDINWVYNSSSMGFNLKNNSEHTLKVSWNDAVFIGVDGNTSKVMHGGIKYADRENFQVPTPIYKKSTLKEHIIPIDRVFMLNNKWSFRPLLPIKYGLFDVKERYVDGLVGEIIRVVLPLVVDEVVIEYIYEFRVGFVKEK